MSPVEAGSVFDQDLNDVNKRRVLFDGQMQEACSRLHLRVSPQRARWIIQTLDARRYLSPGAPC